MRFILNFIVYGIIFFLIWRFFPDAFETMVSWMSDLYEVVKDLVVQGIDRLKEMTADRAANK